MAFWWLISSSLGFGLEEAGECLWELLLTSLRFSLGAGSCGLHYSALSKLGFFFFKWNFYWILSVPRSLCLPFPRSGAYEKTAPCTQYISYKQIEPSFQTKAFAVMFSENASRLNSSAKDTIKIHLNLLRKPFANTLISILKDRRSHLHWVVIFKVTNFVCNVAIAIFNSSEH